MHTVARHVALDQQPHRARAGLFVLLVVLSVLRLLVVPSGRFYWPDESRYGQAHHLLTCVWKGDAAGAMQALHGAEARPAYVLISTLPAAVQVALHHAGVAPYGSGVSWAIPALFNVLVAAAGAALVYGLLWRTLRCARAALFWTAVYGLLCNTNLYIRHLLPYDAALVLFLLALYWILRAGERSAGRPDWWCALGCGALAAAGYLTYPGYYAFVLILAAALAAARPSCALQHTAAYLAAAAGALGMMEGSAWMAGRSYIADAVDLSRTVPALMQGSFEEAYVFVPRYLLAVEGPLAAVLLLGALAGVFFGRRPLAPALRAALVAAGVVLVLHAVLTDLGRMLFYGRIVHMYVPLMVLLAARAVQGLGAATLRRWVLVATACLSALGVVDYSAEYLNQRYPRDLQRVADLVAGARAEQSGASTAHKNPAAPPVDVWAVNLNLLYPLPQELEPAAPSGFREAWAAPHPWTFHAYQFEGLSAADRRRVNSVQPAMRLYVRRPGRRATDSAPATVAGHLLCS